MMKKIYVVLMVVGLALVTHASDYVLYSPDSDKGGEVASDGTWQLTDECLASESFQQQS